MPNPHLLIRPFVCREAFLSSRIEGTQANLAIADSDTAVRLNPDDASPMVRDLTLLAVEEIGSGTARVPPPLSTHSSLT